ncbi:hypothetical protein [Burkholderia glumae]|uniref:hypothetical protein n=1 Tax=Burkholderia glumae TaxID=337 RepID=UPI00157BA265|nr:hypothetical protein [Burkholderia glumae]
MTNEQFPPDFVPINRAKVESIDLYEVTDDELNQLEKGSDGSLFLNVAFVLISAAISFFIALTTTTINSNRLYNTFLIITITFFAGSIICALIWWKNRISVSNVAKKIRRRMKLTSASRDLDKSDTSTEKDV